MSGVKDRRTQIVVAVLGVVVALVAGVRLLSDDNDSSDRSQDRTTNENSNNSIDGDCNAVGEDAEACPQEGEDPAVEVVEGPSAKTYELRTVNWEPQTTITIKVVMPDGRSGPMGDNAKKTTDASGAYTNEPGHWFWKVEAGEPSGMYRVEVTGATVGGDTTTKIAEFEVP